VDVIASPSLVAFNTQSGGHPQVLSPGQTIDALVLQLLDATTARISVAGTVVDLPTQIPLVPGAIVRLAVRGHGTDTKFVIVGTHPRHPAPGEAAAKSVTVEHGPAAIVGHATDEPGVATASAERVPPAARVAEARIAGGDPTVALAGAIRTAAPRQVGLAPLLADAAQAAAAPFLPPQVRQAVMKLLALPPSFEDGVSPAVIREGVKQSGVFLESHLADAASSASSGALASSAAPAVSGDMKAALLTLRHVLQAWADAARRPAPAQAGQAAPPSPSAPASSPQPLSGPAGPLASASALLPPLAKLAAAQHAPEHVAPATPPPAAGDLKIPPPPYRGAPTTGQAPVEASFDAFAPPGEIRDALLARTEGALARMTLLQSASLPDAVTAQHVAHHEVPGPHWTFEVPFVVAQGAAVAHFEITRDGHKTAPQEAQAPTWRANFSLDLEPMGPVHAQIAVSGQRTSVRLWAERRATAAALRAGSSELTRALHQAALETGEVLVRDGAPPKPVKASAGRFLDRAT